MTSNHATSQRMMTSSLLLVALFAFASRGSAQDTSAAMRATSSAIPVRQLKHVVTSDTTVLMGLAAARHLPNGSVLVNDPTRRRLVLFDSTLQRFRILADTSTNSPNSYGLRPSSGGMIPYIADSTIFIDAESGAFLIINPAGEFARVMGPTRPSDLYTIASGQYGTSTAFDTKGRMVYRSIRRPPNSAFASLVLGGPPVVTAYPDSGPLMRMDFDKRTVDTISIIKVPLQKMVTATTTNSVAQYPVVNPLPYGDEWTMLPDGTIAIVRGQDYHMDWLGMDGKITSSPKMPFDWKRITAEEKQQMLDSLKKADADTKAKAPPTPNPGYAVPLRPFITVTLKELPDFYPPVREGQVRADRSGNVWILPSTSTAANRGGLTYDVVNRDGKIVERVQLPTGRTLVGFGPGNTIYMHYVKSPTVAALERAEVAR